MPREFKVFHLVILNNVKDPVISWDCFALLAMTNQ